MVTVEAPQFPSRGPDHVSGDGTLSAENQSTQMQERVKEKEVADQKTLLEIKRTSWGGTSDYNVDSNAVEVLDTRSKSQNNKCSPLSQGQFTLDDEISGSPDSEAKHAIELNRYQEKYQEEEFSPLEEKLTTEVEDTESQHRRAQGGADQQGSRRRRTSGKPFSISSPESSDNTRPSKTGFGSFWELLLEWLYSVFGRLFGSRRP